MPERREWPRPTLEVDLEEIASGFGYVHFGTNIGVPATDLPIKGKVVMYRGGVGVVRGVRYNPNGSPVDAGLANEVQRMFSLTGGALVNFSIRTPKVEEAPVNDPDNGDEGDE